MSLTDGRRSAFWRSALIGKSGSSSGETSPRPARFISEGIGDLVEVEASINDWLDTGANNKPNLGNPAPP
jgi:hypothetical protein